MYIFSTDTLISMVLYLWIHFQYEYNYKYGYILMETIPIQIENILYYIYIIEYGKYYEHI